ncbi:MAG: hypothetical protein ACLU0O_02170 [Collinsella sp.]
MLAAHSIGCLIDGMRDAYTIEDGRVTTSFEATDDQLKAARTRRRRRRRHALQEFLHRRHHQKDRRRRRRQAHAAHLCAPHQGRYRVLL